MKLTGMNQKGKVNRCEWYSICGNQRANFLPHFFLLVN